MAEIGVYAIAFALLALIGGLIYLMYAVGPEGLVSMLGFDPFAALRERMRGAETVEFKTAQYSTEALVCAINVVATGNINHECLSRFSKEGKYGFAKGMMGEVAKTIYKPSTSEADRESAKLECKNECAKYQGCPPANYNLEGPFDAGVRSWIGSENYYYKCTIRYDKTKAQTPVGKFLAANPSLERLISSPSGMALDPFSVLKPPEQQEAGEFVGATNIECKTEPGKTKPIDYYSVDVMVINSEVVPDFSTARESANKYCKDKYGNKAFSLRDTNNEAWNTQKPRIESFSCNIPEVSCTVTDFSLPQQVANAEKWISGYGDPKYLLYWQNFPVDEDTWSFKVDWKIHALIGLVSLFPPTKLAGAGAKLLYGGAKAALHQMPKGLWKYMIKQQLKKQLGEIIKKRLTKEIHKTVLTAVALELGVGLLEAADKQAGSVVEKLESIPNSIVLKQPYQPKKVFEIDVEKPVTVRWRPEAFSTEKQFHLVSPCYLESFEVKTSDVMCKSYINNMADGIRTCSEFNPEIKTGPVCNFDENFNKNYLQTENDVYSLIKKIAIQSKKMAEIKGNVVRIYLIPYSVEIGNKPVYIELSNKVVEAEKKDITGTSITYTEKILFDLKFFIDGKEIKDSENRKIRLKCFENYDFFAPLANRKGPYMGGKLMDLYYDNKICFISIMGEGVLNTGYDKIPLKSGFRDKNPELFKLLLYTFAMDKEGNFHTESVNIDALGTSGTTWSGAAADIKLEIKDNDLDSNFDEILAVRYAKDEKMYSTSVNVDDSGTITNIMMTNCIIPGSVMVDMSGLGSKKSEDMKSYCLRYLSTGEVILKWAGTAMGYGALVVAGFFTGGFAWGIAIAGTAIEVVTEAAFERVSGWP